MNGKIIFASLAILFACIKANAASISPPIQNPSNGHTYILLDRATWTASENEAIQLGGHLATLRSAEEQNWIFQTFGNYGGQARLLWIGLNDAALENDFIWSSGETNDFRNWAPGEPNNSASETFTAIYYPGHSAGGFWNDWNDRDSDPIGLPFNGVVEIIPEPPLDPADFKSLQTGLVASYTFAGDTQDQTANANHGVPLNITFGGGRFQWPSSAALFQQGSSISIPSSASLDIHGDSGLSIAAWLYTTNPLQDQAIINKWGPGGEEDDQFWLSILGGKIRFMTDDESTELFSQSLVRTNEFNQFIHVVAVYDPVRRQMEIFIDGILDASRPIFHPIRSTAQRILIGNADFDSLPFVGTLDDIRIYNRALSPREVRALYTVQTYGSTFLLMSPGELTIFLRPALAYQLQSASELPLWNNFGQPIQTKSDVVTVPINMTNPAAFFRAHPLPTP